MRSIKKWVYEKYSADSRKLFFRWVIDSVWTFPLLVVMFFAILVAFKVHGSSIGTYYGQLYGPTARDPALIYGTPKNIRSDEWLGSTQYTILQEKTGYPEFNKNVAGTGRDLSKVTDAPTKSWITLFRPHNWSFFLLPFDYAFAFRWWFLLCTLIISCYFFTLRVLPGMKRIAILLSISFSISPFVMWWYQASLFLSLAYGFILIIIALRIFNNEKIFKARSQKLNIFLYSISISYLTLSAAFLLYPPFTIPVFISVGFVLLGLVIKELQKKKFLKLVLLKLLPFAMAAAMILPVGALYASQHHDMIHKLSASLYPGKRISKSGGLNPLSIFSGFLMPLLQGGSKGSHFYTNQSEASNYILLLPFLLIPCILIQAYLYKERGVIDWVFFSINIITILFLFRAFIPLGNSVYKILLLDRVPNERLVSGLGFLGLLQLVYMIKNISLINLSKKITIFTSTIYSLLCFVVLVLIGNYVSTKYPLFLPKGLLVIFLSASFTIILFFFLSKKPVLGSVALVIFSISSVFRVMPLYKGLGVVTNSTIVDRIEKISNKGDYWLPLDNIAYENFPLVAGRGSIGGGQVYPDIDFWKKIDTKSEFTKVYNRQGHASFTDDPKYTSQFTLLQPNYFKVKFDCSSFIRKNVDYVLSIKPAEHTCIKLVETVVYPRVTFYIYKVQ